MISEVDKNEMCRMRRLGFTLDYIAKATGYSASSVANVTACVERPLARPIIYHVRAVWSIYRHVGGPL